MTLLIPAVDIRLTPRSHMCSQNTDVHEVNGSFVIFPLQEYFTEVSRLLFRATHYRAFLRDITIVVPSHWPAASFQAATSETFNTANIQITASGRDTPYATQLGGCGQPGECISMSAKYLQDRGDIGALLVPPGKYKSALHTYIHSTARSTQ